MILSESMSGQSDDSSQDVTEMVISVFGEERLGDVTQGVTRLVISVIGEEGLATLFKV